MALLPSFHIICVGCCLTGDINFTAHRRPGPPPPGLMPPEPCHCCEEPDRTPVNLSQVYLTANQTLVTQAVSRSAGRTGSPHTSDITSSHPPCTGCILMATMSAHMQPGLCNTAISAAALPYLADGSSAVSAGRMGKGRIQFHLCFTITAQHRC